MVPDPVVVGRLFDTVAARFADRNGGYTRMLRTGVRAGDAAPMVLLELVDRVETPREKGKGKVKGEKKGAKGEAGSSAQRRKKEKAGAASA
jgi:large subunit ribosomal protein L17